MCGCHIRPPASRVSKARNDCKSIRYKNIVSTNKIPLHHGINRDIQR